jgi:uncharacterized membrane protein
MSGARYRMIDSLRGLALLNMLAFHFAYDVNVIYSANYLWPTFPGIVIWERFICCAFILISGISLNFSSHPFRRGLIVNACGLLITAVTGLVMPKQIVVFGILNCIGCSMLITQALRKLLERRNPYLGAAVSFCLFALFYGLPHRFIGIFDFPLLRLPDALYGFYPLSFLGFMSDGFFFN